MLRRRSKVIGLSVVLLCISAGLMSAVQQPKAANPKPVPTPATDCSTACCAACTRCANNQDPTGSFCDYCINHCGDPLNN